MNEEQLKKYLEDQFSNKEKNQLEQQFLDNPLFDEALDGLVDWKEKTGTSYEDLQNELNERIDQINEIQVSNNISNEDAKPTSILRMPIFRVIAIAASIVGILYFSTLYLFEKRRNIDNIYAAHFKVLTHPDGAVRSGEKLDSAENKYTAKATQFYEYENYKKAIEYYQKALELQPRNEKNILFLGVSYLANFQPEETIKVLENADTEEQKYLADRQWYLALAYLKTKDLTNAKKYLQLLAETESYYTENAKEIVEQLGDEQYTVQK